MMTDNTATSSWLIIDDDDVFCRILKKSLDRLGHQVVIANQGEDAPALARSHQPDYIILDLNIGSSNGMDLIEPLLAIVPNCKILMLTGYASIATAVTAVKRGAHHYLPKPCGIDEIMVALEICDVSTPTTPIDERPSLEHYEWEYIHQVLEDCQGNISEAARVLKMHRRTLQRKLQKKRKIATDIP